MGQEDGAGESILRLGMNNGVNGKMLPIVKASNKIDAIVQVGRRKHSLINFDRDSCHTLLCLYHTWNL